MLWLGMDENRRDAGLTRTVGPWALAASIVNMVIGASIFNVPSALAATLGSYAPLAFVTCAVAIGAIAICFAEAGSRIPTSGGAYGFIDAAFGPLAGYVSGNLLWFSDMLACGGIAAALAEAAGSLVPVAWQPPTRVAVVLCSIGGIAMVNIRGVAHGARLINASTLLKLIPLAIFICVGAAAIHGANFVSSTPPLDAAGLGRALILALFAFTGMETALCASGEVKNPARTIPRALTIGMLLIVGLYVAIQVVAQGMLGSSLATSAVPLADAMAHISPSLRLLMLVGAGVSMLGWLSSDILCSPRILFALARDNLLPRVLGRLHARHRTPYVAILSYSALSAGLALTGTFSELAVLSTLAIAPIYIGACAAALRLARRKTALAGEPLKFRHLTAAAALGVISMLVLIALASQAEMLGLGALVTVIAVLYVIQTRRLPQSAT